MIFLILPCNCVSGWGVCSTNLARELSQKTKIKYVSTELDGNSFVQNPAEAAFFKTLKFSNFEYLATQKRYPIVQAVQHDLSDYMGNFSGSKKIAITFADRKIPKKFVDQSKKFDVIVSGSQWCKNLLTDHGIDSEVILQGIDPLIFNESRSEKQIFRDDFLIFSGGKFEDRKGQDVTLKAYKIFQDRHPEARLVCCWANPYTDDSGMKILMKSGVDLNRVITIPTMPNPCMSQIYQNTDVGVFPSRCEAGTNLVMMEYMACGKPAIATIGTGQSDLINEKTGMPLENSKVCELLENSEVVALWEEPSVDSIVDKLEWVFDNTQEAKKIGKEAASLMKDYTWGHMASKIHNLCF